MSEFYRTVMGKRFFDHQIPELVKSANRLAAALEESNRLLEEKNRLYKEHLVHSTEISQK